MWHLLLFSVYRIFHTAVPYSKVTPNLPSCSFIITFLQGKRLNSEYRWKRNHFWNVVSHNLEGSTHRYYSIHSSSIILFYYRYSLILWFVSGDERSREQVQHPPNQCTGTVCRNTGYCDYTGQGYEPEYDNHSTLEPHGHLPKSCGGSRHWRSVLSIGYVPLIYTLHRFVKSISVLCTSSEQLVIFPFHVEKTQILWKLFIIYMNIHLCSLMPIMVKKYTKAIYWLNNEWT